ncbi:MAG: 30S ribosomal protein S19 [Candidatus Parvarchaeota archaeon]|nr:30S ribosomal protein S19 [Candidatus Parvarchaeota archaeon]MCL5101489.1 30S ribosomal protein S19 [Candidatus Parvarchaeota archaeon]
METYLFRGKTIEQLKAMPKEELVKLVNADARRVFKRGFSPEEKTLLEKIEKKMKNKKTIKTHVREMLILPNFVGLTINIHNGKEFVPVEIKPNMVFHRLGEYALTTKQVKHGSPGLRATRSSGFVPIK